ncbi:MAG: class I SAM-dependent methyltransferase [Acidimicrobiia bacterium]|nr:class I SAM-dependent methyltransferase [Acidimicrobiia bacterium]
MLDSKEEASSYPRGDILLGFCEGCGFIQNVRFDARLVDYSQPTEESQAFSPRFNEFAAWLADELVRRFDLEGKSVLEVGCGKGDFLSLLAQRGISRGLGIDPGFLPDRIERSDSSIEFRRETYGQDHTDLTGDLVLTRHLMEHIPNVAEFFSWLRSSTQRTDGAVLFTEVPDTARVLKEGAFWDVYYEHCSYFTMGSLRRALGCSGFDVTWMERGFEEQYLLAAAVPAISDPDQGPGESTTEIGVLVSKFATRAMGAVRRWRDLVGSVTSRGDEVAIWGGGSKAVAFMAATGVEEARVVDINPHKQGKWLPGVGVVVEPPTALKDVNPALVVAMNAIYLDEIAMGLEAMALGPRLVAL